MTIIRGSVGILAWAVMLVAGLSAAVWLLDGNVASAIIGALVAWGAWKVIAAFAVD